MTKKQLILLFNSADKEQLKTLTKSIFEGIENAANEKFKYNIQKKSPNELLEDIRNFKNFRGTIDEFYKPKYDPNSVFGIGSMTPAGTGPSKSYYMSNHDFLYSETFDVNPDYANKPEVQPIILNEFQPDKVLLLNEILGEGLRIIWKSSKK